MTGVADKDQLTVERVRVMRGGFVLGGIAVNVALVWLTHALGIPLYLDTIGTAVVSVQCGLFHGVFVALASNLLCGAFDATSVYFAIVNVIVAILTVRFYQKGSLKSAGGVIGCIVSLALVGAVLGSSIEWLLNGSPRSAFLAQVAPHISGPTGLGLLPSCVIADLGLNLVDKSISVVATLVSLRVVPKRVRDAIWALDLHVGASVAASARAVDEDAKAQGARNARHRRLLVMLVLLGITLTGVIAWISVAHYTDLARKEYIEDATGAADLAVAVIDPDQVDSFMISGASAADYEETLEDLQNIRDNSTSVKYLYVVRFKEDACQLIFDLDAADEAAYAPGEVVKLDEDIVPYLPQLLKGEEVEPIESHGISGWLLTVYRPVYDDAGECVCYVGADVSMEELRSDIWGFLIRIVLIAASFLILTLTIGMRMSADYHKLDDMQVLLAKQEQDKLLTREIVEAFAKAIDMKDHYTNGHSFRVAEYTAALARELGYDDETVERYYNVALLHDIGKIGMPEELLNKEGSLTEEEYAVIRSHAELGYEALKDISIMPDLAIGAGSHHERPDGKGYPRGLKGDEIPRVAQIIAVADAFDAMYSNRPYRQQMDFDEAVAVIRNASGTQLQADVVEAFLRLVDRGDLDFRR